MPKIWNTRIQIWNIKTLLRVFQLLPHFYSKVLFYSKYSTKITNFIDETILKMVRCTSECREWGRKLLDCHILSRLQLVLCGCQTESICLRNCRGGSKGVIAFQRSLGVQLTPNEISICRTEWALLHSATKKASTSASCESRPDIRRSLTCACSIFALHKDYN